MGGVLNCKYGATCVGILKIVTVLIGIIVVVLLFIGSDRAEHFNPKTAGYDLGDNCASCCKRAEKNCPKKWMIVVPAWICLLACVISAIWLIIFLIVKLENGIIKLLDFVYHIVFGVLVILGGLFALSYACIAFDLNDCEGATKDRCNEAIESFYSPSFFLPASLFAIINGIIYIIVGIMVKK